MKKSIQHIVKAPLVNMGANHVYQPLPVQGLDQLDPFLLIHHWKDEMPGGQHQRDVGVGAHPHRGFSPVTFIFEGDVHHRDSLGNDAIVTAGGTQWMFAGKGITHSERPSQQMAEKGGAIEFIQFWVNAPAKDKMKPAYYKPISKEETPTLHKEGVKLQVICGQYENLDGAVDYFMPLNLMSVEMEQSAQYTFELGANENTLIYLLDGALTINNQKVEGLHMLTFKNDGHQIEIEADEKTRFILLSGEPINEKVTQYGPFVMNDSTQIMQALRDAQMGKMGILIEDF